MAKKSNNAWSELLLNAQRRLPATRQRVQEAFTSDHRHTIIVNLRDIQPDTFYWFDEMTAASLFDAMIDSAAKQTGARLTLAGTLETQHHRLQHIAGKLDQLCLFSAVHPGKGILRGARIEYRNVAGTPLVGYRIALVEARAPRLFIVHRPRATDSRSLGFLTADPDVVNEIANDIDALARGMSRRLETFERLQLLHQTTQQVARELDSYARRMELAVVRARRRPDLLTPERFERIVIQAVVKMEQLKDIPRRALRSMDRRRR